MTDERFTPLRRARHRALWLGALAAMATAGSLSAPSGAASAAPRPLRPHADSRVIVRFSDDVTARDIARVTNAIGVRHHKDLKTDGTRTELLELPAGTSVEKVLGTLAADPAVLFAQPDYVITADVTSNDPGWTNGSLWGMQGDASSPANQYGTGAAEAWAAGYTGSTDVVIGVIDEGIQFDHPDLAANMWTNPGEIAGNGIDDDGNGYRDDVYGWDFYNNDNTTFDSADGDDHGTHVAGTIGAVGGNGVGVAGVSWRVKIATAKFLGPTGGYTSGAVSALNYYAALKQAGVNIVATSNSWGGGGADTALQNAIDAAGDVGILFVAAAGNNSANNDSSGNYPSNYQCTKGGTRGYDCVLAVASITSAGALSSFSNYGATTVDLGAPGSSIYSTVPPSSYATYSGTSMATPHVSGAVALCASINPSLTAKQIREAIINTVAPTTSLSGTTASGGRLDVGAMAQSCAAGVPDNPVTGAPTSLAATAVDDSSINLTWVDGATDENRFEIERASYSGTCGTFSQVATAARNSTSARVGGLSGATAYCFRVRAANDYQGVGSTSAYTNEANATTAAAPTNYTCSADTYAWVTASTGTRYSLGDDGQAAVTLPFTVRSYGTDYTTAVIASNGFLRLGTGAATAYTNTSIPDAGDPNGIIAVWWDDLAQNLGGNIYARTVGTAPNRSYVVSWEGVPHYGNSASTITAQLVLEEATGDVVLQYQDVLTGVVSNDRGASATVGIERSTGYQGTLISYNSASLANLSAYRCTTNAVGIGPSTLAGGTVGTGYSQTLSATGGTSPYTWTVSAGSLPAGLGLSSGGVISGTPTAAGTSTFTVRAADSATAAATRTYSITVVAPPAPGAFAKTAPVSNATSRPRNGLVLSWQASTNVTRYEYCYDTSNNNTCNSTWVSVGTATTATINGLASRVSYYWQVRAVGSGGTTNANAGKWWKFTTGTV